MPSWNELFKNKDFILDTPHPVAEEFVTHLKKHQLVHDLGCGAGRHLPLLLRAGLKVVGSDNSPEALSASRKRLEIEGYKDSPNISLQLNDMFSQSFSDETFDGILSINVINHGRWVQMELAFGEIYRTLKPDGIFQGLLISSEDHRFGQGREVEEGTWVPQQGSEEGIPHHFFNEADFRKLEARYDWTLQTMELQRREYKKGDPVFGILPEAYFGEKPPSIAHWNVIFKKG